MTSDNQDARLGRGLDSMFQEVAGIKAGSTPSQSTGYSRIPLRDLTPASWLIGRDVSDADFNRLVDSVRTHGVIQPVLVRKDGESTTLISGSLRARAAGAAGLVDVPARHVEAEGREAFDVFLADHVVGRLLPRKERWRLREVLVNQFGETPARALELLPDPISPRGTRTAKRAIRKIRALPPPQRSQVVFAIILAVVGVVTALSVMWVRLAEKTQARRIARQAVEVVDLPPPLPISPLESSSMPPPERGPVSAPPSAPDRAWMRTFVLPGVALEPGQVSLGVVFTEPIFAEDELPEVMATLADTVARAAVPLQVEVIGFAPRAEAAATPVALSLERAQRVKTALQEAGLAPDQVIARSSEGDLPPYPDTEEFLSRNQTVTLVLSPRD